MCNTTGPKWFLGPQTMGTGNNVAPPVAYQSNPQQTFDASNPANAPTAPKAPSGASPNSFYPGTSFSALPGGLFSNPSFLSMLQGGGFPGAI